MALVSAVIRVYVGWVLLGGQIKSARPTGVSDSLYSTVVIARLVLLLASGVVFPGLATFSPVTNCTAAH
jgi:hypothetical protein